MRKIMIVDDDDAVQELVGQVLLQEGYVPVHAHSGPRMDKLIAREQPDLILLDLMMPDIDGWQVLEQLQNEPLLADIAVIVFTAAVHSLPDIQEFYGGAVSDYITKPFEIDDLLAKIRLHLPERARREGDESASAAVP